MTELRIVPWSKRLTVVGPVLSLCVAALAAGGIAPAEAQQAQDQQAPKVGTVAVKSEDVADTAGFTGRVRAVKRVDILPRVSGFLDKIGFAEGSAVTDGQILFEIQKASYEAAITQIEGQIKAAQAAKKLADIEVTRQTKLVKDQVSAENVLQEAQAKQGQAEGQIEQLQGALQDAQLNLSYTTITAPFAGRVGLTDMSVGAFISPSTGTMVTLSSVDPIYVTFPVAEALLLDFSGRDQMTPDAAPGSDTSTDTSSGTAQDTGKDADSDTASGTTSTTASGTASGTTTQGTASSAPASTATDSGTDAKADSSKERRSAAAAMASLGVTLTLANGKEYVQPGKVVIVDTEVQEGTDTILVRASFPNPDGVLRDGQLVQVKVSQDTGEDSLVIPAQALQRDQGGYFVLLVDKDNKVEKRPITFGRMAGADVVVAGGLKEGEQVITEGVQRARPGATVSPEPASMQPSGPSGVAPSE